jgi:hypothetical protein
VAGIAAEPSKANQRVCLDTLEVMKIEPDRQVAGALIYLRNVGNTVIIHEGSRI